MRVPLVVVAGVTAVVFAAGVAVLTGPGPGAPARRADAVVRYDGGEWPAFEYPRGWYVTSRAAMAAMVRGGVGIGPTVSNRPVPATTALAPGEVRGDWYRARSTDGTGAPEGSTRRADGALVNVSTRPADRFCRQLAALTSVTVVVAATREGPVWHLTACVRDVPGSALVRQVEDIGRSLRVPL